MEKTFAFTTHHYDEDIDGEYTCEMDEVTGLAKLPDRFYFKVGKSSLYDDEIQVKVIEKGVIFRWSVARRHCQPTKEDLEFASAMLRRELDELFESRKDYDIAKVAIKELSGTYPPKTIRS